MLESGQVINGRYVLRSRIGEGAMASVWRAEDQTLRRDVAIKFLFLRSGPDPRAHVEQFLREARMAAAVQHRNVIHTVDFGTLDDHQPYMVMELLNGEDLGERMAREPKLSPAQFIQLISVTLRGLGAVHDAGIVHRDLKPENIFLQREGETVYPKILDFGISRSLDASEGGRASAIATTEGLIVGTPDYMSPEQARGQASIDKRSDIFSMGVILYEGLTGRAPFQAETVGDLIVQIMTQEAPDMRALAPALPAAIADVVAQAMAKDRERRFADARALRTALLTSAKPLLPDTAQSTAMPVVIAPRIAPPPALGANAPAVAVPAPSASAAPAAGGGDASAGWGDFEGMARAAPRASHALAAPAPRAQAATPSARVAARPVLELEPATADAAQALAEPTTQASGSQLDRPNAPGRPASYAERGSATPAPSRTQNATSAQGTPGERASSSAARSTTAARGTKASSTFAAVSVPISGSEANPPRAEPPSGERAAPPRRSKAQPSAVAPPTAPGIEIDALDPLYAGADQAAPDIDYERVHNELKKPQGRAAAPAPASGATTATKPAHKPKSRNDGARTRATRGGGWRSWLLPLLALALLGYGFFESLFGGFGIGSRGESAKPGSPAAQRADPELRRTRLQVKGRRANPGKLMAHMRDVEF